MLIMLHLVASGAATFARKQLLSMVGGVDRATHLAAEVAGDEMHARWVHELTIAFCQLLFDAVKAQTPQPDGPAAQKSSDGEASAPP